MQPHWDGVLYQNFLSSMVCDFLDSTNFDQIMIRKLKTSKRHVEPCSVRSVTRAKQKYLKSIEGTNVADQAATVSYICV